MGRDFTFLQIFENSKQNRVLLIKQLVKSFRSLKGHFGNGTHCEDVNECYHNEYSNHTCNDYDKTECLNTVGTYDCNCITGYRIVLQSF